MYYSLLLTPKKMARTIQQIKTELTTAFMADNTLAEKYGFTQGADFDSTFSKVSIENLLLYIVAAAIWTHERLFDTHKTEVEDIIARLKPHTLRWYVDKVKQFRYGQTLIDGTDQYDDTNLTDDQIEAMKIVHFAAASEAEGNATVYIKVATDNNGAKQPLTDDQLNALKAYIAEVKDAGVRVMLINEPADLLNLDITVFYDPLTLDAQGTSLLNRNKPAETAINDYIENLPFNSEFSLTALTNAVMQAHGVKLAQVNRAEHKTDTATGFTNISDRTTPHSGYYRINQLSTTYKPY